jgi:tripartite ATP-independent transporter DctP family solute receptor
MQRNDLLQQEETMIVTGRQTRLARSRAIVLVVGAFVTTGMALVGCAAIVSAGAAAGDQPVIEFKGGGTDPVGSPVDQMMQRFVKALAERTDNKIKLTYFAGAQLGGERDIVEGVQLGTVGMAVTGVTGHRIWDALWIPYLFRDRDHMWKVLRGPIGEEWGQVMLKERGMRLFGYAYRSPRNLTTTKIKVTKAADLKGMKIRVPEIQGEVIGWKSMGANPTPMAWPEVLTGLQMGTIDGQENPFETMYANKMWEIQKYLSLTEHIRMAWTVLLDERIWQKITPQNQKVMQETWKEAADWLEQNTLSREKEMLDTFKKNGMIAVEPPELNVQSFRDAAKNAWKEITPKAWGEGAYEKVQATK